MPLTADHNHLIVILGPTAVGKTAISLDLAEIFEGEIISADSRLFYRGMDIGTAKPTQEERRRVPHHLVDVANPDEVWSLAKFQEEAYRAIETVQRRGNLPFLVGGTGQYILSILEGWQIPKTKPDPRMRAVLERIAETQDPEFLYRGLRGMDPEAASRIDPQNLRRTIRALEVIFTTGRLFSAQKRKTGPRYQTLVLGITRPRSILYERIDARIQAMIAEGLVEEVQALLDRGYSPELPPLSAIGYQQVIQTIQGEIMMEEAVMLMKRLTRQYVRRQANWFKEEDERIQWFEAGSNTLEEMVIEIEHFLSTPENNHEDSTITTQG